MATKIVRYGMANGDTLFVEETIDDRGGYAGRRDVVEQARQKFKDALATCDRLLQRCWDKFEGLSTSRGSAAQTQLLAERRGWRGDRQGSRGRLIQTVT